MSTKHSLTLLLCAFVLLTVSTEVCKETLTEGDTCTINLKEKIDASKAEIKWTFTSSKSSYTTSQRNGKNRETFDGVKIESNGDLTLEKVTLNKTGKYSYQLYDDMGTEIGASTVKITVYVKVPKPKVKFMCSNGNATLSCEIEMENPPNLTVTWKKGGESIKSSDKETLIQTHTQLQENKQYSCTAQNPVSKENSDNTAVSCESIQTLFGFDFWLMVSILAGGGALLLLMICVLVICACRSCKQGERQRDEEELRLSNLPAPAHNGQQRSKTTARGQPAPPIPEDSPTAQTPPQAKGQVRARPPPPPQDEDEEDPPPLPRPRKKHHRERRTQEPYRPME